MPSHGSLTKAGKVRSQTPKVEAKEKHKESPRMRNKMEFTKRANGQQPSNSNKRRR